MPTSPVLNSSFGIPVYFHSAMRLLSDVYPRVFIAQACGLAWVVMSALGVSIVVVSAMLAVSAESGLLVVVLALLAAMLLLIGILGNVAQYTYIVRVLLQDRGARFSNIMSRPVGLAHTVWLVLGITIMVFVGSLALLVPGVLFMVWFCFSFFVAADRRVYGFAAMTESKKLTQGRFWHVLVNLVVVSLLSVPVLFLDGWLGMALEWFLIIPLQFAYMVVMYRSVNNT